MHCLAAGILVAYDASVCDTQILHGLSGSGGRLWFCQVHVTVDHFMSRIFSAPGEVTTCEFYQQEKKVYHGVKIENDEKQLGVSRQDIGNRKLEL